MEEGKERLEVGNEFLANAACDPIFFRRNMRVRKSVRGAGLCDQSTWVNSSSFKSAQLETIVGATEMVDKALEKGAGF